MRKALVVSAFSGTSSVHYPVDERYHLYNAVIRGQLIQGPFHVVGSTLDCIEDYYAIRAVLAAVPLVSSLVYPIQRDLQHPMFIGFTKNDLVVFLAEPPLFWVVFFAQILQNLYRRELLQFPAGKICLAHDAPP